MQIRKKLRDPQATLARGLPSVHSSISMESTFPYVLLPIVPADYCLGAVPLCAISSFLHVSTLFIALKFSTLEPHFRSGKRSRATLTDENLFRLNLSKVQSHTVWPEILAGNLFWRIGGFESNPPIFPSAKRFTVCCYTWRHQYVVHHCSKCPHESFKLRKNGTKIVHTWSTISLFQLRLMYYGLKRTQQCLHYNRSSLLHMSPFCYEYNYGIRLTQPPK